MKLSCDGCKHKGKYENEVESGLPSPCTKCQRRCSDNYDRTDMQQFKDILTEAGISWEKDIIDLDDEDNDKNAATKYIYIEIKNKGQIDINFREDESFHSVQFFEE